MRFAARLLVLVVGLLAGMAAGTPALLDRIEQRVEAALERSADADLTWAEMTWDWSLSGAATLQLTEVALSPRGAPAGEAPLATARRIEIQAQLLPARRKARIKSIVVHGARLEARRRPDGTDNVRDLVAALKRSLARGGDAGAGEGGGLGRYLDRHLPRLEARDLTVVLESGLRVARLPGRVELRGGSVVATNEALLKEDDHLHIVATFADSSLDPGRGLRLETTIPMALHAVPPISLAFDGAARIWLGERALAVGGLSWDGEALSIDRVALSVPIDANRPARDEPVDPALTAQHVLLRPDADALPWLLSRALAGAAPAELATEALARLERIEVERPVVVFERRPEGHNFSDLVGSPKASAVVEVAGPDTDLGPLMEATHAAVTRLASGGAQKSGRGFRGFLVRGFSRLEAQVGRVSGLTAGAARVFPFRHLVVREGQLAWRDALSRYEEGVSVAGRLENFDFEAELKGEVLEFSTAFIAPGSGRDKNRLEGRVHLASGDVQLRAAIAELRLFPYRQVFPASMPIGESARLEHTDATLLWSPQTRVARLEGTLGVRDLSFSYRALASEPLSGITGKFSFDAQLDTERKTLVLGKSQLDMVPREGAASVRTIIRGDVASYDDAPKLTGAVRLERARCQDVFEVIPLELVPMLTGLQVEGTIGWQLDFSLDTQDMESLVYHSYPELNQFQVVDMGERLNLDAVRGTFLHRVILADGTTRDMLVGPGAPGWVPLGDISSYMVRAVMTTEDGSFYRHQGFSAFAIRESIVTNLKKGGFYRGASTISQQLVKNLFLTREKTISRKLQELFITWQLESSLDKDRIMALYLNIIEWGPGIYGIRQAAQYYFDKHPSDLTALDAVFLASLIPNPRRYHHQFSRGEVSDGWRRHLRWIMRAMVDRGRLSEEEFLAESPWSPQFRYRGPELPDDYNDDHEDIHGGGGGGAGGAPLEFVPTRIP